MEKMGVNVILVVLVVSVSFINAQDFAIFDQSDFNAWDAEEEGAFLEVDQTITSLCQNYNLVLNNKEIDCAALQLVPKVPEEHNDHVIQKRDADEAELEGSGNEPANIQVANFAENTEPVSIVDDRNVEQHIEDIKKATVENKTESLPTNETTNNANKKQDNVLVPSLEITNTTLEASSPKPETTKASQTVTTQNPVVPVSNNETLKLVEVKEEAVNGSETSVNKKVVEASTQAAPQPTVAPVLVTKAPIVLEKKEGSSNSTANGGNQESGLVTKAPIVLEKKEGSSNSTANGGSQESGLVTKAPIVLEKKEGSSNSTVNVENKESGQEEASPKMLPSDLAEVESIGNKKEVEPVNEQQSGNVVMLKHPKTYNNEKESHIEGSDSDRAIQRMAEKAKISNETDQPSTGESAKNVNRASKDTTILVVLFVIVIAIGGAAFTHNFIKKRKQKSKKHEVVNGLRRSLQNLTAGNGKNTNNDVEQGTELKPLMKENSPTITKQFTDVKTEAEK